MGESESVRSAVGEIVASPRMRVLLVAYFLLLAATDLYQQALPLFVESLGISTAVLGLGFSVGNGLEAIASPLAGAAADAYDRFALAALCAVALSLVVGLFALVDLVPPVAGEPTVAVALVGLMALVSVARLSLNNAMTPAVNAALEDDVAGLGWGIRDVAIYLGSGAGLLAGAVVVSAVGSVRFVFGVLLVIFLGLAVVLWRAGSLSLADLDAGSGPADRDEQSDDADDSAGGWIQRARPAWPPSLSIESVPRPRVLGRFAVVKLFSVTGMGMTLFLLPVFATDVGIPAAGFLFLFAGTFLVSAPLSLVGGFAADRYDRKRLYVGNFFAETLMLGAFAVTGSIPLFVVGTAFYVAQTAFEPAVIAFFFAQFEDDEAGRAWGLTGTVSKVAGAVAPAVGGVLYGIDPTLTFGVGAALLAGATLVAVTIPRPEPGSAG